MAYLNNLLMVVAAENVTLLFAQCLPSMLLGGWQEGHPARKKNLSIWYSGGGDLTGALHVLQFQFAPPPLPSSLAALTSKMV